MPSSLKTGIEYPLPFKRSCIFFQLSVYPVSVRVHCSKTPLDYFALLCYNQGGRGKAPARPFGIEQRFVLVGRYAVLFLSAVYVLNTFNYLLIGEAVIFEPFNQLYRLNCCHVHCSHFLLKRLFSSALRVLLYYDNSQKSTQIDYKHSQILKLIFVYFDY